MPDKDGQGEDGVDWLASQLGGGAKPANPDEFVPRKGAPLRSKDTPAAPADPAPKPAGFLWGLKPTTETDPHLASTDAAPPAATPATAAPVPADAAPRPARAAEPAAGHRAEPLTPAQPADLTPAAPTPARTPGHAPLVPEANVRPEVPAPASPAAAPAAPAPAVPARSEADLEPAPWWTTPAQSPLVPTAEETADALRAGAHAAPVAATPPPLPIPAPAPTPALRRFRARAAAPAPLEAETPAPETPAIPVPLIEPAPTIAMAAQPDATPPDAAEPHGTPPDLTTRAVAEPEAILPETRQARRLAEAAGTDQPPTPAPSAAPTVAIPAGPAASAGAAGPAGPDAPGRRRGPGGRSPARPGVFGGLPPRLVWIAGALLAVIVLVGLFFLGRQLVGGIAPAAVATSSAAATPTATPTPTAAPEPTGPQPVGVHKWNTLFGGECLQPYVSPWEEDFTVADCAAPHAAQLVYRGTFPGDAAAAFPGEEALASQINLLCSATGVIDLPAAAEFADVQVQGSYPVTAEQWAKGPHYYYCFVNRSGGEPLSTSVAGPGPAPAG